MTPSELESWLEEPAGGVYYFYGSDEFRKEEAARALADAHLDEGTRDFNHDRLRGSEVDVERLASVLGTPPMMAAWRVVVLRETQALASSARARALLMDAVASPPPGLALILLCTVPDRSSARFYRDLEKASRSVEFRTPDANDLPGWLMDWSRESFQREIEESAARALAQAVGADVSMLARELEKLTTLVGEGEVITLERVEAAGTRVPRQDRWEWFDLIGGARFAEALTGLPILLQHGETGVGLTIGLGTQLLRIGIALEEGAPGLESTLPPRQRWLARRYVEQARRWTLDELRSALVGLRGVDHLLKTSGIPDGQLLEGWILERMVARGAVA